MVPRMWFLPPLARVVVPDAGEHGRVAFALVQQSASRARLARGLAPLTGNARLVTFGLGEVVAGHGRVGGRRAVRASPRAVVGVLTLAIAKVQQRALVLVLALVEKGPDTAQLQGAIIFREEVAGR